MPIAARFIRETIDSGVRAGRSALEALGRPKPEAEALAAEFIRLDNAALLELAPLWNSDIPVRGNAPYMDRACQIVSEREARLTRTETKA